MHTGFPRKVVDAVMAVIEARLRRRRAPLLAGLSGVQGSGKSTLAAQLVHDARARGINAIAMSIDDFYFGRRARQKIARDVHPLLATRGVPGTHDIELLERTLDALSRASAPRPASLPRFDKGRDTRAPPSRWSLVTQAPQLIVLEGWCVAIDAQNERALLRPINALERRHDADRRWRTHVNAQLRGPYARIWRRFDLLVLLQAPGFDIVARWRDEQERVLRRRHARHALTSADVTRFVEHFERLSRHALRTLPGKADLTIVLDEKRTPQSTRPGNIVLDHGC